ncbi:MAG: twin-arginine translocase TatA/TatE family subunit [Coleofasciculaceae cyanobacterium SM2_1_6]|nr:twin-arginine translocase TatA/TatE family subunit [Coleofasciculaceae cyanobacterium SM2_1_6]
MFGLGLPEMAIIGVIAVLIFGPKKIPELGSALGKTLKGFKDEMSKSQVESSEATDAAELGAEDSKKPE